MASVQKELKEIVREAENQGWTVKVTKKGHLMFYAPDGKNIVTSGGTPSDHRSLNNLVAKLRQYGFTWKGR
jgi:predicted RNA binding protein YcfA (HicA-like mRNA interferase family)